MFVTFRPVQSKARSPEAGIALVSMILSNGIVWTSTEQHGLLWRSGHEGLCVARMDTHIVKAGKKKHAGCLAHNACIIFQPSTAVVVVTFFCRCLETLGPCPSNSRATPYIEGIWWFWWQILRWLEFNATVYIFSETRHAMPEDNIAMLFDNAILHARCTQGNYRKQDRTMQKLDCLEALQLPIYGEWGAGNISYLQTQNAAPSQVSNSM